MSKERIQRAIDALSQSLVSVKAKKAINANQAVVLFHQINLDVSAIERLYDDKNLDDGSKAKLKAFYDEFLSGIFDDQGDVSFECSQYSIAKLCLRIRLFCFDRLELDTLHALAREKVSAVYLRLASAPDEHQREVIRREQLWPLIDDAKTHLVPELRARMAKAITMLAMQYHARRDAVLPAILKLVTGDEARKRILKATAEKKLAVAFFTGGPNGSGKSQALRLLQVMNPEPPVLSADTVKFTYMRLGRVMAGARERSVGDTVVSALPTSPKRLHLETSQVEYQLRQKLLRDSTSSIIYDGSLRQMSDVNKALAADKFVVVRFSVVPFAQSLIRVLARPVSGPDPRIPFDYVKATYIQCLKSVQALLELSKKNERLLVQVYAPKRTGGYYDNDCQENIYLTPNEALARVREYINDYRALIKRCDQLTICDLLKRAYFSTREIERLARIPHITGYLDERTVHSALDHHASKLTPSSHALTPQRGLHAPVKRQASCMQNVRDLGLMVPRRKMKQK